MAQRDFSEDTQNFEWWDLEPYKEHIRLIPAIDFVKDKDKSRQESNLKHMRLYGNLAVYGFGNDDTYKVASPDKVTLNVVKMCTDTVSAKITKNRPRPVFLTSGGNYSARRKAKLLEKWVDTQFYLTEMHKKAPRMIVDACVFGDGILKVYREGTQIKVERTFPGELYVDQAEGLYGEPRQLFQQKYVSRSLLMRLYPHEKLAISMVGKDTSDETAPRDNLSDQILVTEAWFLPSHKEEPTEDDDGEKEDPGDGRHVICIPGLTLLSEEYCHQYFPFVKLSWTPRLRGYWGHGLAEELTGLQVEINKLLMKVQRSMHLASNVRVYLETGSKITKAHINNEIGSVINYVGSPPIFHTAQSVHPEIFQHIESLYQKCFSIAGISQDAVGGQIPSGLETGQAVREYRDLGTERFSVVSKAWEEAFLDVARIMVDLGSEIAEEYPNYKMVAQKDKYTISEMKWEDICLEDEAYILKVYPASALPTSPSGRRAEIADMLAIGMIDMPTAKKLMDFPDIDDENSLDRAASDHIDHVIEAALDDGELIPPEPFDDLELAIRKVQAAYNRARDENVPEDRLTLLREFMELCTQEMMMAQAAMSGPAPQGAPSPAGSPPPDAAQPQGI